MSHYLNNNNATWQQVFIIIFPNLQRTKVYKTICRVQLNPELEELRKSVPQPPNVDEILDDIVQKTSNIHAAFLFCGVGEKLLQQLCRCLCATRNSLYYSGWKELGIELGLDPLLPQVT